MQLPQAPLVQFCVPVPFVTLQERTSLTQRSASKWKLLLQAVSWQLPQAPLVQLCVPVPLPALQTRLSAAQMPASMW